MLDEFEVCRKVNYRPFENKGKLWWLSDYPYLDIVFNDHCNAKCAFCIGRLVHDQKWADVETIKRKAAYAIQHMGVREVLLLGGEPTVNDDIFEVIDFLKQFHLAKICITTNGHRMLGAAYLKRLMASGVTHVNVSLMSLDLDRQREISGANAYVGEVSLREFARASDTNGVRIRINNNVFLGNNDSVPKMLGFYNRVKDHCDSVKFSPLLRTDSFSTVNEVTEFNRKHLLADEHYDELWHGLENVFRDFPIVRNPETFGFVEYSMILTTPPIILNYNQHGQLRKKVVEQSKINNLKLLPTGDLSLSWNREETDFFIDTSDADE